MSGGNVHIPEAYGLLQTTHPHSLIFFKKYKQTCNYLAIRNLYRSRKEFI